GSSTTAPETVAEGDTAPSFVAPRGTRGLGATTLMPAGRPAAPAPEAETARQSRARSGAATSARKRRTRFMYFLLSHGDSRPPECGPNGSPTYRTREVRCQL